MSQVINQQAGNGSPIRISLCYSRITGTGSWPGALVDRKPYIEFFSKLFSREIFGRRSILEFMSYEDYEITPSVVEEEDCCIDVIAEGIETQAKMAVLELLRCREGQGYLFARPLAAEDFVVWFESMDRQDLFHQESGQLKLPEFAPGVNNVSHSANDMKLKRQPLMLCAQ